MESTKSFVVTAKSSQRKANPRFGCFQPAEFTEFWFEVKVAVPDSLLFTAISVTVNTLGFFVGCRPITCDGK